MTAPNAPPAKNDRGVSTGSPDSKIVYLHMLNLTEDGLSMPPVPDDLKVFVKADYGDNVLGMQRTDSGYSIVLPENNENTIRSSGLCRREKQ